MVLRSLRGSAAPAAVGSCARPSAAAPVAFFRSRKSVTAIFFSGPDLARTRRSSMHPPAFRTSPAAAAAPNPEHPGHCRSGARRRKPIRHNSPASGNANRLRKPPPTSRSGPLRQSPPHSPRRKPIRQRGRQRKPLRRVRPDGSAAALRQENPVRRQHPQRLHFRAVVACGAESPSAATAGRRNPGRIRSAAGVLRRTGSTRKRHRAERADGERPLAVDRIAENR